MVKVILIVLFGLILHSDYYAQQKIFGYKISGNGDIISDVFFIQDGFILDSITVLNKTYRFKYNEGGKLIRDINFIVFPVLYTTDQGNRVKYVPGYRHYHYNQRGDVDSVGTGIWSGTPPAADSTGYSISHTYDNNGNLLSKIYSSNGDTFRIEENSYDSSDNLILKKIILRGVSDTTYITREYDSQNRLIKESSKRSRYQIDQNLYQYDSSGNINCTTQTILSDTLCYNNRKYYLEFDESGKVVYEIQSRRFYPPDSTWLESWEILFDYDEYGKVLRMGETAWFHYNADGNLDSLVNTHPISSGYLANKVSLLDSYGNSIPLPELLGPICFYYSKLVTDIKEGKVNDMSFSLFQNYPNPFNPSTIISYSLPKSSLVTLKIYDILGREIATLVNEEKPSGKFEVKFDGSNLSSGVYFYRIQSGSFSEIKKFMLIR